MRDRLIRYLDATEDMMIYLLEHRDTPGTSKAEVRMCNLLWQACAAVYSLLKWAIRREKRGH